MIGVRGRLTARLTSIMLSATLAIGSPLYAVASASAAEPVTSVLSAPEAVPDESLSPVPPGAVEDISRRSEHAKHYRLPDGSITAVISEEPVHHRDDTGAWIDIDTTMVLDRTTGRARTASTPVAVSFGPQQPGGSPARVEAAGHVVGIDLLGASEGATLMDGSSVRYARVALGTDLVYETFAGGVKETLELSTPLAPDTFRFFVDSGDLDFRRDFSRGWVLADPETGSAVFDLGELVVFDSSSDGAGDPQYCADSTLTVSPTEGGGIVTYEVSRQWLADPDRVYPVYVDPSLTAISGADTYASSKYPTTAYGTSTELRTGYYDATTGHNRSFLQFDVSSIPSFARVDSATFSIYQFHTYYPSTATTTYLCRPLSAWSDATTWNTRPASTVVASQAVTGRGVWVNWSQAAVKDLIAGWVSGSMPNYGLACQQYEDGTQNTTHWRKFYSKEYSNTSLRPRLVVNYTTVPDPVTDVSASSHRAFEWFREVDRDGDAVADTPNDLPRVGRGAVDLAWSPAARAAGYKIMMFDGDTYEQVGQVFGASTTSWSSEGLGIAPRDS
ncbi:MAG: DNRLRE domain-containing protein, partial [Coriobacteriia bacterium]|nr:DNRLRE domain-containing protein [Coriobacteriia bacterium]